MIRATPRRVGNPPAIETGAVCNAGNSLATCSEGQIPW
jgi:hypothetical protein